MTELTRRRVLAAGGTAVAGAIAGCSSSADEGDDGEEGTDGGEDGDEGADTDGDEHDPASEDVEGGTILGDVTVENLDNEEHAIDVLVEFDGEIEHWSTHRLDAGEGGVALERTWPAEPGWFRVTARLDEDEFWQVTPDEWNRMDCLTLTIMVTRDGAIRIPADPDGDRCDSPLGDGETERE